MKKFILVIVLLIASLLSGFSQTERITANPQYRSRDCKFVEIVNIEITNACTFVTMRYSVPIEIEHYIFSYYIAFKKGYIESEALDSKYKLMESSISHKTYVSSGNNFVFTLNFKPIKQGIERINIIGGYSEEIHSDISFYGVKINNPIHQPIGKMANEIVNINDKLDFVSDVDKDIPTNNISNEKTFAVVIGNETYTKEIEVKYALKDARIFKEYLLKTLGLPECNIQYIENGTLGQILDALKWINEVTKVYNGQSKIIFYYAGHGMPDEQTKSAYLLPVDGNSQNTTTAIKLADIYNKLSEYPSISVTVFLDACFSGATRETNGTMLTGGRGVKVKPIYELITGNLVVFSATTGDETAFPYTEKQHGMFTYFLLKKMQDSKGKATLNELSDYIVTNVTQKSVVLNRKSQTPQVNTSAKVQNTWQTIKLK